MQMLRSDDILAADLADRRKLGQGLHARFAIDDLPAGARFVRAVAAGGTVVDDSQAPSYVVIADPEGNKACVCTFLAPAADSDG